MGDSDTAAPGKQKIHEIQQQNGKFSLNYAEWNIISTNLDSEHSTLKIKIRMKLSQWLKNIIHYMNLS
jgi:hypothetical protein